jgi:phosphate transport system permease protein
LIDTIGGRTATRKIVNSLMCGLLAVATIVAITPLLSVFSYVVAKGMPALSWSFFTKLPLPVGEVGGGMANALVGTVILVALASLIGIPWGLAVGIYLSETGIRKNHSGKSKLALIQQGGLAGIIRFATDMISSVPSIIIGLFVYALMVLPMKRFSAISGGVALGILMVPTVARSAEELLRLVPQHIREAGLALGLPRWKVTLYIVLRAARSGILTGIMLAVARVAGETAPLLFTAFGNRLWHHGLDQPIASLPVQIYTYAISPYEDWHAQAWAGALVLVGFVFIANLITRVVFRSSSNAGGA